MFHAINQSINPLYSTYLPTYLHTYARCGTPPLDLRHDVMLPTTTTDGS